MSESGPFGQMDFTVAWRAGKLVIIATVMEGPEAGGNVVCVTPRADFLKGTRRAVKNARSRPFMRSLRDAIRDQVKEGTRTLTPQSDGDFMSDLSILMAVKLAIGEPALEETGLFSIALAIDPDTSLAWDQRGFLNEADARNAVPFDRMSLPDPSNS